MSHKQSNVVNTSTSARLFRLSRSTRYAMTLTELLVVVGIIVILLLLSVPAAKVWESRKFEDSINLSSGVLQTAQTLALTENNTVGLFFYIDPRDDVQYIWPIEPFVVSQAANQTGDRFKLRDTKPFALPKPYRVVPISVLETNTLLRLQWTPPQLTYNRFFGPSDETAIPNPIYDFDSNGWTNAGTQFHRNFFVMLFDANGQLIRDRQITIYDRDEVPATGFHPGFRTGITVSQRIAPPPAELGNEVCYQNGSGTPAIPFLAATGFIIYDDERYQAIKAPTDVTYVDDHRAYLRRDGQSLYVHPLTGKLIKGESIN